MFIHACMHVCLSVCSCVWANICAYVRYMCNIHVHAWMCVCAHLCVCMFVCACRGHTCGDKRTTTWCWFSSSTMCVLGIEPRLVRVGNKRLSLLNYFTGPRNRIFYTLLPLLFGGGRMQPCGMRQYGGLGLINYPVLSQWVVKWMYDYLSQTQSLLAYTCLLQCFVMRANHVPVCDTWSMFSHRL